MSEPADLGALRGAEAFGRGVRTSLMNNASAYGYSVTVTAAFGLVSSSHAEAAFTVQVLLFALGVGVAFVSVELVASRRYDRLSPDSRNERELLWGGALDALAVLASVGAAAGLAQVPGLLAWPVTGFGSTLVFLLMAGVVVLVARRAAREQDEQEGSAQQPA